MATAYMNDPAKGVIDSYENALASIGTGRFHLGLLLVCGWANAADAVEVMAASFLLPSTSSDLGLSEPQKGWLAAVIFIGMLLGGAFWGILADRIGRRRCLIYALLINCAGGFFSAWCSSFEGVLLFRLLAGLGVGGSIPVIFTYFIEFFPTSTRGTYMVYLAWFWMVGAVMTSVAAWLILPLNVHVSVFAHPVHTWRIFYALCSLPSLLGAIAMTFSVESPRFLIAMNRIEDAKAVLLRIAQKNLAALRARHDKAAMLEEVQSLLANLGLGGPSNRVSVRSKGGARFDVLISLGTLIESARLAFSKDYLVHTVKLLLIWFTLSFGFYGLTLWIPEYFAFVNQSSHGKREINIYAAAFASAVGNLPGNIWSVFSVRSLGRAKTLAISIGLSAASVALVPFSSSSPTAVAVVVTLFGATSVGAWNALNIATAELYPTDIRASTFGMFATVGKIGAVFGILMFGRFLNLGPVIPMLVTATALTIGTIASLLLRETKDALLS